MSDDEIIENLELENKVLNENNKGLKEKIDEQRKEIEKLQKALMTATLKIEGLKIEAVYNNNYISKDKIKNMIKELEDIDEYEAPNGWESERDYAKEKLNKLLGE